MSDISARLIVFSGLPGSGKTTIASEAARRLGASFLRIDTIEQGLRDLCGLDVRGEGYRLAQRIAADGLRLGQDVIADCVNPWELTRREWAEVAASAGADCVDIEVVCSDEAEHRRRVEARVSDIPGLRPPSWEEILGRGHQPWGRERIVVETSGRSVEACVESLLGELAARRACEADPLSAASAPSASAGGETHLDKLLASIEPELGEAEYVFALAGEPSALEGPEPWASVREEEGCTHILERGRALGLECSSPFKRITLRVHSSLQAVGLTAAVAAALASRGISANVVAAYYHDHVFVPADRAEEAVAALEELSRPKSGKGIL